MAKLFSNNREYKSQYYGKSNVPTEIRDLNKMIRRLNKSEDLKITQLGSRAGADKIREKKKELFESLNRRGYKIKDANRSEKISLAMALMTENERKALRALIEADQEKDHDKYNEGIGQATILVENVAEFEYLLEEEGLTVEDLESLNPKDKMDLFRP